MIGRVVSIKMKNTAVVLVEGTKTHPLYKKSFLRSKRFLVDDQIGVKLGDLVEVNKIRPVSKLKHWKIEKVVGRNIEEIVEEELKEKATEIMAEVMPPDSAEASSGKVKEEEQEESKVEEKVEKTEKKKTKRSKK